MRISTRFPYQKIVPFFILVAGLFLAILPQITSGWYTCVKNVCGFNIGTNYRDGMWFLAVAKSAFVTLPFRMPNFAGQPLQGYHFLPNLMAYILSLIGIPLTFSYFQIMPLLYAAGMGFVLWKLTQSYNSSWFFHSCIFLFVLFGMHLAPWTSWITTGTMSNYSLINTFQATRILESPHTALALILLFYIIFLIHTEKLKIMTYFLLACLALCIALGTKVYVATTIFSLMLLYEFVFFWQYRNKKTTYIRWLILIFSLYIAYILFYSTGSHTASPLFVFSPFATVHHLIETDSIFPHHSLVLARYYLYSLHHFSPRLLAIELYSTFLYVVYYFGVRIIGIIYLALRIVTKKATKLHILLFITILSHIAISVLFIQRGDWFNPIQFAVPVAFISSLPTAEATHLLYHKNKMLGALLIIFCIGVMLPGNVLILKSPWSEARFIIPDAEMDALRFLENKKDGTVFYPIDGNDMAIVPAFTGKVSYVNFVNVLQNAGIEYKERLSATQDLNTIDVAKLPIRYYMILQESPQRNEYLLQFQKTKKLRHIFHNKNVDIFEPSSL